MATLIYEPRSGNTLPVHILGIVFVPFCERFVRDADAELILHPVTGGGTSYRRTDVENPLPAPVLDLDAAGQDAHKERVAFAQSFLNAPAIQRSFERNTIEEA